MTARRRDIVAVAVNPDGTYYKLTVRDKVKLFFLRRYLMNKLKVFFSAIVDPSDSAAYAGFAGALLKVLCLYVPAVCPIFNSITEYVLGVNGETTIAGLIGYAFLRMTSKAAKAKSEPKPEPKPA